jgi:hypothetical protein
MPNWKKVIVSGSSAALTSVTATAGFTGSLLGTASFAITASHALNANNGTPLFTYTQSSAASTWNITHNLATVFPIITVYSSSNDVIVPQEITSINSSSISITFPISVAGYASIAGGSFSSITPSITTEESIITSIIFG